MDPLFKQILWLFGLVVIIIVMLVGYIIVRTATGLH
jgi:hypothetical protein